MTDPRYTDPRENRRLDDPTLRGTTRDNTLWAWVAAIAVLVLIAFVLIAGWNNAGRDTATTTPTPPATTGTAPSQTVTPPPAGTTGSGTTSPQPSSPSTQPSPPPQSPSAPQR